MPEQRELIALLGRRFIQRKDVKAIQKDDGSWYPARDRNTKENLPFKMDDFARHLAGEVTLGHYMVDQDNQAKLFALDIDLRKDDGTPEKGPIEVWTVGTDGEADIFNGHPVQVYPREEWLKPESPVRETFTIQLRCLAEGLARYANRTLGIPVAVANSGGKGLHVYGFTGTLPAEAIRELAVGVLEGMGSFEATRGTNFYRHTSAYEAFEIEVFPKQGDMSNKEYGNLMALPLGTNRKTGKWREFISCKSAYNKFVTMDPFEALEGTLPWE